LNKLNPPPPPIATKANPLPTTQRNEKLRKDEREVIITAVLADEGGGGLKIVPTTAKRPCLLSFIFLRILMEGIYV
jgi:hypothetical protein